MNDKRGNIEIWHSEHISAKTALRIPEEYLVYDQLNDDTWEKYGKIDDYPDYLLNLYRSSNKHNGIIGTKVNLIMGLREFSYEPRDVTYEELPNGELKKVERKISDAELKELTAKADAFFERIKIRKQLRAIATELCVYGGGFVTVNKPLYTNQDGLDSQRKIASVKSQKFIYARRGKIDVITNEDPQYNYYCVNFRSANKFNSVTLANYNPKKAKKNVLVKVKNFEPGLNELHQSLYYGLNDISRDCYPTPDYESKGSLASIESDYELAIFDIAEAKNGFVNDYIYVVYRSMKDDEELEKAQRSKETKQAREQFKGSKNAGGFIMNWIDPSGMDKEILDAVKNPFIEIPHNKNYQYISEKRSSVSKEILSAHGVIVAELAGLQGYGNAGFSSQAEMILMASKIWSKQRINPLRSIIEEQVLDQLLEDEGIPLKAKIARDPHIERSLTENMLKDYFVEDEIREMFGYEPRVAKQKPALTPPADTNKEEDTDGNE